MRITVYTDGSCRFGKGGWGAIAIQEDICIYGSEKDTTNNRMEMMAIIETLRAFPNTKKLLIYSDSNYAINCAQKLWKRNKNLDLWKEYDKLALGKDIVFKWVKGHDGNVYNERVDCLAKDARDGKI